MTVSDAPETRGHLVLTDKAFSRIAAQCAAELPAVGGKSGGFLGFGQQEDFDSRPKVSVELTGNIAALAVEVGLRYPAPIAQITDELRSSLRERVTHLTGVDVRQVDIRVTYLQPRETGQERVLL